VSAGVATSGESKEQARMRWGERKHEARNKRGLPFERISTLEEQLNEKDSRESRFEMLWLVSNRTLIAFTTTTERDGMQTTDRIR
jgi:hypothetical protein